MNATSALETLRCLDCGARSEPAPGPGRCADCGGRLDAVYDLAGVDPSITGDDTAPFLGRTGLGALLPPWAQQGGGQGETPLVDVPALADDLGIAGFAVKDEGCNPTGSVFDRGLAVAVAAARSSGATDVALPTMGNSGQAAAAAAARAGLASHSFVPSRTPFVNKAMINVHGGDMTVVEGRYRDAAAAFEDALADADWHSLAPFETSDRKDGAKPIAYEIAAARGWQPPDAVVVPTGQVTALVGIYDGFRELDELGVTDELPRIVAAEAAGCGPLSSALEAGSEEPQPVEHPDTVCGHLEIPNPAGGSLALEAIETTDGTAVAPDDDAILEGAATLAEAGGPTSVTGGAGVAAIRSLVAADELGERDDVVLVNPVSANKEADLLRSHLMSKGR